jgi:hypothetical protein
VLDKEQSRAPTFVCGSGRDKRFTFPVRAGLQHSVASKSSLAREASYAALGSRVRNTMSPLAEAAMYLIVLKEGLYQNPRSWRTSQSLYNARTSACHRLNRSPSHCSAKLADLRGDLVRSNSKRTDAEPAEVILVSALVCHRKFMMLKPGRPMVLPVPPDMKRRHSCAH